MRTAILTILLLFNFYALSLVIFSNFASSDDVIILKHSNFAKGVAFFQINDAVITIRAFVGLSYVAIRDSSGVLGKSTTATEEGETIYTWNEFCGNFTGDEARVKAFADLSACRECAETSGNIERLFMYSVLAMLPLLATNVLRRFPNYDVRKVLCRMHLSELRDSVISHGTVPFTIINPSTTGQLPKNLGFTDITGCLNVQFLGMVYL